MSNPGPTACLLASLINATVQAQCPFDPTIVPSELTLCISESGLLATQAYDTYQWYKNDLLISGATAQSLPVSGWSDIDNSFSVLVTLNGCAELSDPVYVHPWKFLLPSTAVQGDPYTSDPDGHMVWCEGDTALLIVSSVIAHNIQWTNFSSAIPGANNDTLVVTEGGSYDVSGGYAQCPDLLLSVGSAVDILFQSMVRPVIESYPYFDPPLLCPFPRDSGQWYLNGDLLMQPFVIDNCIEAIQAGTYTVSVDYGMWCQAPSEPFDLVLSLNEPEQGMLIISQDPTTRSLDISWNMKEPSPSAWYMFDIMGRTVLNGAMLPTGHMTLDLDVLPAGHYWFSVDRVGSLSPIRIAMDH